MTPQTKLYEAVIDAAKKVVATQEDETGDYFYKNSIDTAIRELNNAITAYKQEQQEAIARDKTIIEIWKEWCEKDISWTDAALGAMRDFASQQTSAKDKEIAELKEAISELIQVKDWKDKYGKDEHYLKAMPIAWENARKLIQK